MIRPSRTIWDTRIQCICGVIASGEPGEEDIFLCANFGQATLDPPRLVINPNRIYPIEGIIRRTGRFSVSMLAEEHRDAVLRLIRLRRREPEKARQSGLELVRSEGAVPWIRDAMSVVTCDVESVLDTGDHTVIIGRVTSVTTPAAPLGNKPLLYRDIAGRQPSGSPLWRRIRRVVQAGPIPDLVRKALPAGNAPVDLPRATYREGGFTHGEMDRILSFDVTDRGRVLSAPKVPAPLREPPAVCVVGTRWGESQCQAIRAAAPGAPLFLCGRDPNRTGRLAAKYHAAGWFAGLDAALSDARIRAVVLALPHHLHREAAEAALRAGKDVLVEKPIATSLADADAMIATAERSGRILMVAENMHFRPSLAMVARRVVAGDAGEPLHLLAHAGTVRHPEDWVADKTKLGGGVFMDIGIHYVRAMRLLMGEPDQVSAFRPMQVNTRMEGEDGLESVYRSRVGWLSHLFTTWSGVPGILPDLVLIGDAGTFHLFPMAGYYDFYPVAARPLVRLLQYVRPYALQERLIRPAMHRERVRFRGSDEGYIEQMREFLAAVAEGRAPLPGAEAGRRDLEIVLATYDAMERGGPVAIPPYPSGGRNRA